MHAVNPCLHDHIIVNAKLYSHMAEITRSMLPRPVDNLLAVGNYYIHIVFYGAGC